MSIFDQFNANPYIRTYAGAPIQEQMQVAATLTKRAETNLANMDKLQLTADAIPAFTNVDKAYKQQLMGDIGRQIEELSKAPEHATSKVRRLATKTATDPALKAIQATAGAAAKWQEAYGKDPAKYGDVAAWEFQKAVQGYEEAGGAAAGAVFQAPALYELKDINKFLLDNGKAIAASEEGIAFSDGKFIHEKSREEIHPDRVKAILEGAIARDSGLMRQLDRERRMYNEMNGTQTSVGEYVKQQVEPYVPMFAYTKTDHSMKGDPTYNKGNGHGGDVELEGLYTQVLDDVVFETGEQFSSGSDMYRNERKLAESDNPRDNQMALRLKAARIRAIDKAYSDGKISETQHEYLSNYGLDVMPLDGSAAGQGGMMNPIQDRAMSYAEQRLGLSGSEAQRWGTDLAQLFTNPWFQNTLVDYANDANSFALNTKYVDVWAESGIKSQQKAAIDKAVQRDIDNMDQVKYLDPETNKIVNMPREEFDEMYDVTTASVGPVEINGSGLTIIRMKNADPDAGDGEDAYTDVKIQLDPEVSGAYRWTGNYYTNKANNAPAGSSAQMEAAGAAVNITAPEVKQAFEFSSPGVDNPITFGGLNQFITNKYGGNITAGMDLDGNYVVKLNGRNLFENNEEFLNLAKNANANEMAALTMQYLRQDILNQ